jgi:toxin ParE1/3/4
MDSPRFEVLWSEQAGQDLAAIADFIAQESSSRADAVLDKIVERVQGLEELPIRGRVVPELSMLGLTAYREVVVRPWRVIYRVSEERIFILAILDGRRDMGDLLLERLVR